MASAESLYRSLLLSDWIALIATIAVAVAGGFAGRKIRVALAGHSRPVLMVCAATMALVASTPLLYVFYLAAQIAFSSMAVAVADPALLLGDQFAANRAKLMLLSDGLEWWPPAYPGWILRTAVPALFIVLALWGGWRREGAAA